jgi:hypothetical protein
VSNGISDSSVCSSVLIVKKMENVSLYAVKIICSGFPGTLLTCFCLVRPSITFSKIYFIVNK